jgi:hypothetical protein
MAAIAASAGSLTGLLFVALSVAPRPDPRVGPAVIQQIRASAALLAFSNALAISLFSLVPGTNSGYPAVVMGIIGLFFTAAALRSIMSSRATMSLRRRQTGLIVLLLLIFGTELVNGITALLHPHEISPVEYISYGLVASVLVGVARAWELVSDRDTGILASLVVLTHREHAASPAAPSGPPAAGGAGAPDGHDPGARDAAEPPG